MGLTKDEPNWNIRPCKLSYDAAAAKFLKIAKSELSHARRT
jgi:hypothetical protein